LAISNLGLLLEDIGQRQDTAMIKREVLEKRRRILGNDYLATILAINNLANSLRDLGQLEEAAEMKKEVLEKKRRILSNDYPSTI
jgi:hypothetical protein